MTSTISSPNRRWFITGAGSGLGRSIALCAFEAGDTVVGTVRTQEDLEQFEACAPGRAKGYLLDLRNTGGIADACAFAEDTMGGIDVLVNNAGYGLVGAIEEASGDEIRTLFDVNFFGPVCVIQQVLPGMRCRGSGHIINITSVSGLAPWAGTGIYGASKYAMECIGQTLAEELEPLGIKVTNVEPGGLRTGFASRSLNISAREIGDYAQTAHTSRKILQDHAGEEPGDPEKAAQAIAAIIGKPDAPLHLLLGADALHYAERKLNSMQTEIKAWSEVTLSTAIAE